MIVDQYRPNYCSGFEDARLDVQTTDELLALDWIKSWTDTPGFHRFVQSGGERGNDGPRWQGRRWWTLMVELHGGAEWWVVAHVSEPPDLPVWDCHRAFELKAARQNGGQCRQSDEQK